MMRNEIIDLFPIKFETKKHKKNNQFFKTFKD